MWNDESTSLHPRLCVLARLLRLLVLPRGARMLERKKETETETDREREREGGRGGGGEGRRKRCFLRWPCQQFAFRTRDTRFAWKSDAESASASSADVCRPSKAGRKIIQANVEESHAPDDERGWDIMTRRGGKVTNGPKEARATVVRWFR